jgi:hypothetical protein
MRSKEPSSHQLHMFKPLRNLEYVASREFPSLVTAKVLECYAKTTELDGTTRVSVRDIARQLDRSPGTIHYHVKRLVELGFLEPLGDCREGNRHRPWRVAGMDRREYVKPGPGENHHRSRTSAREHLARNEMEVTVTARDALARTPCSGELLDEKTRASTQQEPLPPRDWGRANDPVGIRQARDAVEAARRRRGAPGPPEPPTTASDGASVPEADSGAENGTEGADEGAA